MASRTAPFAHEALLYDGDDDFVVRVGAFLAEAVDAGIPALVAVADHKITTLRRALGPRAGGVVFADLAEVGRNPATIIPVWKAFVDGSRREGVQLRGVGEPLGIPRPGASKVECHAHESLLNEALAGAPLRLLCPYDVSTLPGDDIEMAVRNHPHLTNGAGCHPNNAYDAFDWLGAPLPAPPSGAERMEFELESLPRVRRFVDERARAAGLRCDRRPDLVLAISEVATNSVRYGGGRGTLSLWTTDDELLCEIADAGRVCNPMIGRIRPAPAQEGGHGLWLANQLVDLVQLRSNERGTSVRLVVSR